MDQIHERKYEGSVTNYTAAVELTMVIGLSRSKPLSEWYAPGGVFWKRDILLRLVTGSPRFGGVEGAGEKQRRQKQKGSGSARHCRGARGTIWHVLKI